MQKICFLLLVIIFLMSCKSEQPQQAQPRGLQKIYYKNQDEIQQLRKAGAEIIVQEPDYVIVRTDSMLQTQTFKLESIKEADMVQRLVKIYLKDSTDLQKVVNSGVDLWEVKADTAVARAFDIYIERLREAGLSVKIIARDASQMEEK